jgi:hypothetical protein
MEKMEDDNNEWMERDRRFEGSTTKPFHWRGVRL